MLAVVISILLAAFCYKWGKHTGGMDKALDIRDEYFERSPDDFEDYLYYEAFDRPIFSISSRAEQNVEEKIVPEKIDIPKNVIKLVKRQSISIAPKENGPFKK